ncbi:hypothetical protein CXF61_05565 [Psychrobacter sp. 4Dc]|nr:hypothetical protein CXF61_05565 [Psychrobacter sp. 4Dc]
MYSCTKKIGAKKTSTKKKATEIKVTEIKVTEKMSLKTQLLRITLNALFFIITDIQVHNTQL